MQITVYSPDGLQEEAPERLATLLSGDGAGVWVDLDRSRPEDVAALDRFGFHPLAVEDARKAGQRPKAETYDGVLFLTFHAPRLEGADVVFDEIDLFFTPRLVVTVRPSRCPVVEEARRRLARAPAALRRAPAFLVHTILDTAVDAYFPVLDALDAEIDRLEDEALARPSTAALARIFRIRRALLDTRRHIVPLRDTLSLLMRHETEGIVPEVGPYLRDVFDHVLRITDQIDTHRDLVTGALEVYLSQVSHRLNEVMKVLTVITAVFAALTVITGIYGMNFERAVPAWEAPGGFWGVLGFMGVVTAVMLALFRWRGWV
jgi:magnesium transporter